MSDVEKVALTDDELRLCREAWNAAQTTQSGDRFAPDVLRLVMLVNRLHAALAAHLAEVRAAIGPVAEFVNICGDHGPTDCRIGYMGSRGIAKLEYGDLRRLAALAKKLEAQTTPAAG